MSRIHRKLLWKKLAKEWMQNCAENEHLENVNGTINCGDDVYDLKMRGDRILAGLHNGDVEVWDKFQLKRLLLLRDLLGQVQVEGNGRVIVGVSDDSSVAIWDTQGTLLRLFHHHKASVYGVVLTEGLVLTGDMVSLDTMEVVNQWVAHADDWGVADMAGQGDRIVTCSLSGSLKLWRLPTCELVSSLTGHSANCISICWPLVATCSRTGQIQNQQNINIWNLDAEQLVATIPQSSTFFIHMDSSKVLAVEGNYNSYNSLEEGNICVWDLDTILLNNSTSSCRRMPVSYKNVFGVAADLNTLVLHEGGGECKVDRFGCHAAIGGERHCK